MPVATGGGGLKLLTPVKPSCDTVATSVGAVPGAIWTMGRWPPAAVVPTDTVLAWSAIEPRPNATAPWAVACAFWPSAVDWVPLATVPAPNAVELPPLAVAPAPSAVPLPPAADEAKPIAVELTPVAVLNCPKALAPLLPALALCPTAVAPAALAAAWPIAVALAALACAP